jgi:UDP-4-amino-4-deoxy-L-arabinose formyltransferase/UDP-glucuronic acid dehydrogenase (UDP-4-keto-hexauronic acid decarboxylating)
VLLAAEESAGVRILKLLSTSAHQVVAVLTTPDEPGRGAGVEGVARGLDLEVVPAERVRDPSLADTIREWEVDLLLNVHSLFVVHGDVVAAPRIGSFNLHPGPLPEYAGLNVPSWAILNGESRHAVTLHWMEPGIDTGAIAYEAAFDITPDDTGLSVSLRCIREGIPLLTRLLEDAAAGRAAIPSRPQDLARRRFYGRDAPDGGRLRWDRSARDVVNLVRASDYDPFPSPWGRPHSRLGDVDVEVLQSALTGEACTAPPGTVGRADETGALVAAADEWVLVRRVARPGEAPVGAADLLRPGMRLGAA